MTRTHTIARLALASTLALGVACATPDAAPADTSPTAAEQPASVSTNASSEAQPAQTPVVYGELEERRTMFIDAMAQMAGPYDRTEIETISGPEALEVLEARVTSAEQREALDRPMFPFGPTMRGILSIEDLQVWFFRGHGEPLSEINALYIPFPQKAPAPLNMIMTMGPGIQIPLDMLRLKDEETPPETPADLSRWPTLDAETFDALMTRGAPFVVYQHMSTCPSSPTMNAVLTLMELPDDLPLYIDHDFAALEGRVPSKLTELPASSFVAFNDGDWIDLYPAMVSPVAQTMNHFLARNGLIANGPTSPLIGPDAFTNADDLARGLTLGRVWSSLALPNHDLRGIRINEGAIAGSDFSGADLRKARFTDTLLSHTSFEGARTEGITLDNVTLRQVTCVDGSVRSGEVGDCLSE